MYVFLYLHTHAKTPKYDMQCSVIKKKHTRIYITCNLSYKRENLVCGTNEFNDEKKILV